MTNLFCFAGILRSVKKMINSGGSAETLINEKLKVSKLLDRIRSQLNIQYNTNNIIQYNTIE